MVSDMRICFDNDGNAYLTKEPYGVIECQTKEDFEKANEAIEKQIPKKVLPEQHYYGIGKCSRCGVVFTDDTTKYCGNCGQAIEWEEGEKDNGIT